MQRSGRQTLPRRARVRSGSHRRPRQTPRHVYHSDMSGSALIPGYAPLKRDMSRNAMEVVGNVEGDVGNVAAAAWTRGFKVRQG